MKRSITEFFRSDDQLKNLNQQKTSDTVTVTREQCSSPESSGAIAINSENMDSAEFSDVDDESVLGDEESDNNESVNTHDHSDEDEENVDVLGPIVEEA